MTLKDESTLETLEEVTDALSTFNHANSDVGNAHQKIFVLRDAQERLIGGIVFVVYWYWLHVEILVVNEAFRGRGFGQPDFCRERKPTPKLKGALARISTR